MANNRATGLVEISEEFNMTDEDIAKQTLPDEFASYRDAKYGPQRKFRGVPTGPYLRLLLQHKLTTGQFLLLCRLYGLQHGKNGYCNAGNKFLADDFGVSVGRMEARIQELREAGWIKTQCKIKGRKCIERIIHCVPVADHDDDFLGNVIPADLWLALRDRKVSKSEACLLLLVDAYVDPEGDDCWASTKELAKQMNTTPAVIQVILSSLTKKGLIIRTKGKRHNYSTRFLRCSWSRIWRKSKNVNKTKGSTLTEPRGVNINKTKGQSNMQLSNIQISDVVFCENDASKEISSMPFMSNGEVPHSSKDKANPQITAFDITCAKKLQKLGIEQGWIKANVWSPKKQAKYIAQLRAKVGRDEVQQVVDWYCSHQGRSIKLKLKNCLQLKQRWDDWNLLENSASNSKPGVISEEVKDICEKLFEMEWPGSKVELVKVVQKSYDNIKSLNDSITRFLFKHVPEQEMKDAHKEDKIWPPDYAFKKCNKRHITLAAKIWWLGYFDPPAFLDTWFAEWWQSYCYITQEKQQEWKGGVKCMVFDKDSLRFKNYLDESDRFESWNALMKGIAKNEKV